MVERNRIIIKLGNLEGIFKGIWESWRGVSFTLNVLRGQLLRWSVVTAVRRKGGSLAVGVSCCQGRQMQLGIMLVQFWPYLVHKLMKSFHNGSS